jgi:hypothetical protein
LHSASAIGFRITEFRYFAASLLSAVVPSIEIFIYDTVRQSYDPSYLDYMSPFGFALVMLPIFFCWLYACSRVLGWYRRLSYRILALTLWVSSFIVLIAVFASHIGSMQQVESLVELWATFSVPAVTTGYVWLKIAGFRNSIRA